MGKSEKTNSIASVSDYLKMCPVCNVHGIDYINVTSDNARWYRCSCGVIFQGDIPEPYTYTKEYQDGYRDFRFSKLKAIHAGKVYAPVLEELIGGRKFLDVGFNTFDNMEFFKERGWLCWGMDVNESIEPSDRIFKDDFETAEIEGLEFNVIWMSHVFEHFKDPLHIIRKCYNLLREDGVLYIATPDIDSITNLSIVNFPHFNKKEHYIMWSKRSLIRELQRFGYEIILARRNPDMRYTSWHDIHIIAQKRCF